ncbi:MAG: VWA domain-containing protein [Rhodocyclaceae bacterium]|nr:VWA domain-containing protein [Rhodocyclaceae bacterium]MDZ4216576.1 VWA domain-containing protein [Rhodocyclaceae bacterium]
MSERRLFEHELEEKLDALLFASASHRAIGRAATQLEALPREAQNMALLWVGAAAQTSPELGHVIAMFAAETLARLDLPAFEAWAIAGLDIYDKEGLRAAVTSMRDLDSFIAMREGRLFARFAEVEQRLVRFVQGLSGRPLAMKAGAYPWTDTETIYLPERMAHFTAAEDNRQLYKGLAVQLWAQTRYGTFAVDLDSELARWPERETALTWLAHLEAVRLEACIARELPGLAGMLAQLRGAWPEEMNEALADLQAPGADVRVTLAWLGRFMEKHAVPPAPTFCGRLEPGIAGRVRAERITRDTDILKKGLAALKGVGGKKAAAPNDFAAELNAETGAMEFSLDGEAVQLTHEAQAAAQSLLQDLGEVPPEALTAAGDGMWTPVDPNHLPEKVPELASDRKADFRYDEWDYHRNAYRRGWCHVYEVDVKPGSGDFVRDTKQRYAPFIQQLKRRFEAVRGEDRIIGRQPEGEEIDLDALVEAVNDRRSGAEPSARLFSRRVRNDRSLAAMFMVDMSGSTKGWINDAERESLVMLCEALEKLGDRYAIYGFSGWTRTRCDIYRIKRFAEPYSETVRGRIDAIEAKDYTRMGVAIRHLSKLLAEQPARHKLLVTLSDGRPDDFGDEYRGTYGIEDTRRALQEARQQGIRSYCITIDRHGADYLKHMVGPASYTVLDDVKKLPLKVADIYRKLTA